MGFEDFHLTSAGRRAASLHGRACGHRLAVVPIIDHRSRDHRFNCFSHLPPSLRFVPFARVVGFSQGEIVGAEVPGVKECAVPHKLEFDADLGPVIEQLGGQRVHVVPKLPEDDSRRRQLRGTPPPDWQCVGFVVSVRLSQVHRFLVPNVIGPGPLFPVGDGSASVRTEARQAGHVGLDDGQVRMDDPDNLLIGFAANLTYLSANRGNGLHDFVPLLVAQHKGLWGLHILRSS
jgi:hypothetical protein